MDRGSYRRVINAFRRLDGSIKTNLHNRPVSCKGGGCFACCCNTVNISQIEAMVILKYCENIKYKIDFDNLSFDSGRCLFLDKSNKCVVYPVRPIACRTHFVSSAPELCAIPEANVNKYDTRVAIGPMVEVIMQEHKHYGLKTVIDNIPVSIMRVKNGRLDRAENH
jgi:Fe-S-cluster containining protein